MEGQGDCGEVPMGQEGSEETVPEPKAVCKRLRATQVEEDDEKSQTSESALCLAKKARGDAAETFPDAESDDDDDFDDLDDDDDPGAAGDSDFLDEDDDDEDVMMEDDRQSVTSNSTTGSSVGSNTPSLVGENLESFNLSGCEGDAKEKKKWQIQSGPLVRSSIKPLKRSLFSHVPPSINFVHHNEVSETPLPAEVRKHLRWKLSNITPAVVKRIVTNSGFRLMRKSCSEWGGSWGKHMKSYMFKDLQENQKLNHLPGTFNIGRKDRLWKNYQRLRKKFGKEDFSFLPRTFLLPSETKLFRRIWERKGNRTKWIVKPPALARGNGIKVVNKWNQIPKCRPLIVQKYVAKPHLINNTKYDLRIYVLLTSVSPLRVFLYDEGLVRFASNTYSSDNNRLSDVFTHLTNYSINRHSSTYQANEESDCRQGHKWTLASLWTHFAENGIDSKPVIESIKDLIIKTIVSAEHNMYNLYRPNLSSHYCGYELFGFDVLLDHKLKPWLIEVNISPSLHSSSPLDLDVKSPLATEVFNICRYHIPPAKMSMKTQKDILTGLNMKAGQLCMDRRLYARELTKSEKAKQDKFVNGPRDLSILDNLTPDDVRQLIRSEDELAQTTHFSRIFPTQDTHKYFKYFDQGPRYYNLLFDAWESKYGDDNLRAAAIDRLERLCVQKYHLKVPTMTKDPAKAPKKVSKVIADVSVLKAPTGESVAPAAAIPEHPEKNDVKVKVSTIAVTAKHHAVKSSSPTSRIKPNGIKVSSTEEMSTSIDTSTSAASSEKSRSPTPVIQEVYNQQFIDDHQVSSVSSSTPDGSVTAITNDNEMKEIQDSNQNNQPVDTNCPST